MNVPFLDLPAQNSLLKDEILPLWEEILLTAGFIGGRHVSSFEQEFARACGVDHAVAVGSGTDALRFILLALGLAAGGEVITVPNTFIATTEAISQAGGEIVFVDVDPVTRTLDPSRLEAAITPRTRGIVPVHLYGQPADMDPINAIAEAHGLWVVEDACQAHLAEYHGRKAGSLARAAAFSFYPGKNLGACGEAGAVTTNDAGLAARIRRLRDHGQQRKYIHEEAGYNGRCDALQAAALRVKLARLSGWNESRRGHAARYQQLLADIQEITLPLTAAGRSHVFHLFVILVKGRDAIRAFLEKKGIATGLHYPVPLHLQRAYAGLGLPAGSFPVTESHAARLLSLPLYPEMTEAHIARVCEVLKEAIARTTAS